MCGYWISGLTLMLSNYYQKDYLHQWSPKYIQMYINCKGTTHAVVQENYYKIKFTTFVLGWRRIFQRLIHLHLGI